MFVGCSGSGVAFTTRSRPRLRRLRLCGMFLVRIRVHCMVLSSRSPDDGLCGDASLFDGFYFIWGNLMEWFALPDVAIRCLVTNDMQSVTPLCSIRWKRGKSRDHFLQTPSPQYHAITTEVQRALWIRQRVAGSSRVLRTPSPKLRRYGI